MRKDFKDWDYNHAQSELAARQGKGDKESLAYVVDKDNWQDGSGWSGPQITGGSAVANTLKEGINRDFTPKGAAHSVVRRFRRGTVGRESSWTVYDENAIQNEDEQTFKSQVHRDAEALLLQWWNHNKGLRVFREAVSYCATVGRGPLRLYPPPGTLVNGRMPRLEMNEAVKQIFLLAKKPDEATVITDDWTMQKAGVYTFLDEEDKPAIGICYLNEQGKTVIKTLKSGSSNTAQAPGLLQRAKDYFTPNADDTELDLNGNLLVFELDNEPLITESVKRQQKLLDKALTMLSHNMDEAGFREQVFFNTMPPGKMITVDDPDNPGQTIEVFKHGPPSSLPKGAGARLFAQGTRIPTVDPSSGRITGYQVATPSRDVTEPVPVTSYTDTARAAFRNILEDTDQLHVLISGDADSSGESRKQARDDHTKSLEEMKSEVDYIGSAVLKTVLLLTAIFSGKPGYFDGIDVSFNCRIDPGPLSSEDRRMNIEEMKEEIKSLEDARIYAGSNDPDALKTQIEKERNERPAPLLPLNPEKPANGDSQVLQ